MKTCNDPSGDVWKLKKANGNDDGDGKLSKNGNFWKQFNFRTERIGPVSRKSVNG